MKKPNKEINWYKTKYPYMLLSHIEMFEDDMKQKKVSKVSRERGFLKRYKEVQGKPHDMGYRYKNRTHKWLHERENFIKRHLAQVIKKNEPLYDQNGMPTRRTLSFYAWAFDPMPQMTRKARLKKRR